MAFLLDTNVLVRLANAADARHAVAARAVLELHRRGESLHITPQVLVEFRNVATRPAAVNGLGFSTWTRRRRRRALRRRSRSWRRRPTFTRRGRPSSGRPGWSASRCMTCAARGGLPRLRRVATVDVQRAHFTRLAEFGPGVAVVDPASV